MQLEEIVELFKEKPERMTYGAGKLAKRYKTTKETIYKARRLIRAVNNYKKQFGTEYHPKDVAFKKKKIPKILLFDIESTPSIAYTWRRFKENISLDQVIQDPVLITWSAKWLYSTEIMNDKITVDEIANFDDKRIVESLWKLVDDADIVIAHYGDMFDIPMLNARAIINGLKPFSQTKSIDTKKVASSQFRFPSNKLDALGTYFKVGNKIKTDFNLWKNCILGKQSAIDEMSTYNDMDVIVLEEVYLKLRPYIKSHPNIAMYLDAKESVCSCCGSNNLTKLNKPYATNTAKYDQYRCNDCGGLTRGRKNIMTKQEKDKLMTSIPR